MSTAPHWDDDPESWDRLVLAGRPLPGLARVTGRAGRKVDIRSPPGGDGARVRDRGYEPAQLEIELRVWSKAQLDELETALAQIHPRGANPPPRDRAQRELADAQRALAVNGSLGNDPGFQRRLRTLSRQAEAERRSNDPLSHRTPVDIVHPALSLLGIRSVYVTGVSVPELRGGELVTTISVLEWTPAPTPGPRPANASAAGGGQRLQTAFAASRSSARPTATPPARVAGPGSTAGALVGGGGS